MEAVAPSPCVPEVAGDGRLAIRAGVNGTPAPAPRVRPVAEERGDRVAAAVPGLRTGRLNTARRKHRPGGVLGKHRPGGVLGKHRDHRLDVAPLHRVDVVIDYLPQALVADRTQRRLLALLGYALTDRLAGALQGTVHRGDGRLERLGDLAGREAEHVALEQDGALVGRQMLERRDERQLHALALLVASLRRGGF